MDPILRGVDRVRFHGGYSMKISDFAKEYLAMQGVLILPPCRKPSKPYERPEEPFVPVVPEYERGDLP